MKFEKININDIIFSDYNPRKKLTGKDSEYHKIKKSIQQFGYVDPIILNDDNTIIGGNQRCQVLIDLGYKEVDVIKISLDKNKEKALNIALNKITGEWDFEKLTELLNDIKIEDQDDFLSTGFDHNEFDKLLKDFDKKDQTKGDDFDAAKAESEIIEIISQPGDLYQVGRHFLLCGDSTNIDDVTRLLQGIEPILMATDPPYGVNYQPEWRNQKINQRKSRSTGKVDNDNTIDWSIAYDLFPGHVAYVWHAGKFSHIVAKNLEDCNYEIINQIIWVKQHFAISRGDIHWQHECCWYACKKGNNHNWQGARDVSTIWNIKSNNPCGNTEKEKTYIHSTQKPIDCMLKPILNNTCVGQAVYDPFCGSGTTLISAEQSGRICYAIETNPLYCDVIIKRFCEFTNSKDNIYKITDGRKVKVTLF